MFPKRIILNFILQFKSVDKNVDAAGSADYSERNRVWLLGHIIGIRNFWLIPSTDSLLRATERNNWSTFFLVLYLLTTFKQTLWYFDDWVSFLGFRKKAGLFRSSSQDASNFWLYRSVNFPMQANLPGRQPTDSFSRKKECRLRPW